MSHAPDNIFALPGQIQLLSDEQRVLADCRSGDWSSYGRIVERYQRMVWAAVDSVLSEKDEVPDVVQEVFIRAFEKLGSFRGESAFSSWLYRLARNHALSHLRSRRRRPSPASLDEESGAGAKSVRQLPAAGLLPETEYLEAQRLQQLSAMLSQLEPPYREVLNLHYLGELSMEQMAELLSIPVNTAKTRLRRAKLRLVELAERGGWR